MEFERNLANLLLEYSMYLGLKEEDEKYLRNIFKEFILFTLNSNREDFLLQCEKQIQEMLSEVYNLVKETNIKDYEKKVLFLDGLRFFDDKENDLKFIGWKEKADYVFTSKHNLSQPLTRLALAKLLLEDEDKLNEIVVLEDFENNTFVPVTSISSQRTDILEDGSLTYFSEIGLDFYHKNKLDEEQVTILG